VGLKPWLIPVDIGNSLKHVTADGRIVGRIMMERMTPAVKRDRPVEGPLKKVRRYVPKRDQHEPA